MANKFKAVNVDDSSGASGQDEPKGDIYASVLEEKASGEQKACFVSRYARFQCSIVPINRKYSESGLEVSEPEDLGREIRFEDNFAYVEDDRDIAAMLKRSDFGDAFCIDPLDRTGFWAQFAKTHPEVWEKVKAKSLAWKDSGSSYAATAMAHAQSHGLGSRSTEVKVVEIVGGRPPILSGGRDTLTEDQEQRLAEIGL